MVGLRSVKNTLGDTERCPSRNENQNSAFLGLSGKCHCPSREILFTYISWPEKFNQKLAFLFPHLEKLLHKHYQIAFQEEWQANRIPFQTLIIHQMLVGDSFWSKVQGYWKMAFNLNYHDFAIVPLPKFLYFLYYPLRLWRLIKTYKIGKNKILLLGKNLID